MTPAARKRKPKAQPAPPPAAPAEAPAVAPPEAPSPEPVAEERRAPDQDGAAEVALVEGTLPPEDRRAPEPVAPPEPEHQGGAAKTPDGALSGFVNRKPQ